jgi:hypothetical protein
MLSYEVIPGVGVGPVRLGMTRAQVRAGMSQEPERFRKSPGDSYHVDAFHQAAFQVFYAGDEPRVEYIELSRGQEFNTVYRGVEVFSMSAQDLVAMVSRDARVDDSDPELDSYIFPDLELSLWRPDEEDRGFSTIGIGIRGYYSDSSGAD